MGGVVPLVLGQSGKITGHFSPVLPLLDQAIRMHGAGEFSETGIPAAHGEHTDQSPFRGRI